MRISWSSVIQNWYSEVNDWKYGVGSTNGKDVGHFTQVRLHRHSYLTSPQKLECGLLTFGHVVFRLFGTIPSMLAVQWPTVPITNISITMCASTAHRKYTISPFPH